MTDQIDLHHRGMIAAASTINAAGASPFDSDGELLVPADPTAHDWQAELDDLDREDFTDPEREAFLDGWGDVMVYWRTLVNDGTDAPEATRRVAGLMLRQAAAADEPAARLRAARELLGDSQVEMSQRLGIPTQGHQAQTVGQWERGRHVPDWENRKKIRRLAERLLAPLADQVVDEAYESTDAIIGALDEAGGDLGALADQIAFGSDQDVDEIYDELHNRVDGYTVETTCEALDEACVANLDALAMPLDPEEFAKLRLRLDGEGRASWRVMVPQASGAGLIGVEVVLWKTGATLLD